MVLRLSAQGSVSVKSLEQVLVQDSSSRHFLSALIAEKGWLMVMLAGGCLLIP